MSTTAVKRPTGYLLVERHIEKNAGSTFREILFQAERRGLCMYWGYQQRSIAWNRFMQAMNNLSAQSVPPRVCMEAHSHIDHGTPWLRRLEQLQELQKRLKERSLPVSLLFQLRLRRPLSQYISYYLWTVVERQDRAPHRFGRTFEEWARSVPNLQTELMLSSKAAFAASFAPHGHADLLAWKERWATAERAEERRELALRTFRAFDFPGTTERFDETTLLLARALNWSVVDASAPPRHRDSAPEPADACLKRGRSLKLLPWYCRMPGRDRASERQRVHRHVCPNTTSCQELIRRVAPVDHELYALASAHLDRAVASAGPTFAQQLQELRLANKSPVLMKPLRCAWRPLRPTLLGGPQLDKNGRQKLFAAAPDFLSRDVCLPGDPDVLATVWSEHRMGGRANPGWPVGELRPLRRVRVAGGRLGRGGRSAQGRGAHPDRLPQARVVVAADGDGPIDFWTQRVQG